MTIIKKMAFGVLIILFVVFIGTYLITMNSTRNFFMDQMNTNAQDTASALASTLSKPEVYQNPQAINSLAQVVFDSGYFSSIQIKDINGEVLFSKASTPQAYIPNWFIQVLHWTSPDKSSAIMDAGIQKGTVIVTSDLNNAYSSLWASTIEMGKIYLLFAVITLMLVYGFIRLLLRPLKRVTEQALAISSYEFPVEKRIPKTLELKQVTIAMNQMVGKIKSLFEEQLKQTESLRLHVYQDPLTGLSNRRYFLQQLTSILYSEDEFVPGYVLFLVVYGLDELNQQCGYQQGDNLILTISKACKNFWKKPSVSTLARINGSTFAIINHERDSKVFNNDCKMFEQLLKEVLSDISLCDVHLGAVPYFAQQSVSNLLTLVDLSVKQARESGVFYCQEELSTLGSSQSITVDDIHYALEHKTMTLHAQSISDGSKIYHKELFVRMRDAKGDELGAGYFMPIADQLSVSHLIDLYVLKEIASKEIASKENFALNLSENTLANRDHSQNYIQLLKIVPKTILNRLSIEIHESIVLAHFTQAREFIEEVKKLGVTIGVDRVGVHFSPLHYLSDLKIDYIKLHGSLVQDIDENESKQFFIHYFNETAKTLDIQVVATQVELQSQWQALQFINIHWGQGRFLGDVNPLP